MTNPRVQPSSFASRRWHLFPRLESRNGGADSCNYIDEAGGRRRQQQQQQQQLIPGLPDEIGMECLVRVPYGSHSRMKSSILSALFKPSQLPTIHADVVLKERDDKKQRQEEGCQYNHPSAPPYQYGLSIFNATYQTWHQMMPSSIPMFCHCVALPSSGKLLLLGGWDPTTLDPVPDVYVLNLIGEDGARWRRAAPMSVARSFFACAVVGRSTVYVAGGHDSHKNALRSAEVYDAEADEWRTLPSMWEERDESQGLSWEGDSRFWVVSGYSTENQGRFRSDAECYDPETGCWSKVEGLWPFPSSSPRGCVSVNSASGRGQSKHQWWRIAGEEQQQQQTGIGEIREYEREAERWRVLSSIPLPHPEFGLGRSSKCLVSLDGGGDGNSRRMLVMSSGGEGKQGPSFWRGMIKGKPSGTTSMFLPNSRGSRTLLPISMFELQGVDHVTAATGFQHTDAMPLGLKMAVVGGWELAVVCLRTVMSEDRGEGASLVIEKIRKQRKWEGGVLFGVLSARDRGRS
ncbi:F-box/kelch-repeat protein SKIP20 [Vitis vinifera]|uniref:F-box/kelch-repeat protein SKIP20 n=1 Tax=Vitis vinifera TaxID=29760 RepID=A0A438G9Y4_VITVI|nr:F-box/kelch-repeat protein SKIP20 [Vitis vinifera]